MLTAECLPLLLALFRARRAWLNLRLAAGGLQYFADDAVVDLSGVRQVYGVTDDDLHSFLGQAQTAFRIKRLHGHCGERAFQAFALRFNFFSVPGKYFAHAFQHDFFHARVIAPRRQGESDLMPEQICAGSSLKDAVWLKAGSI